MEDDCFPPVFTLYRVKNHAPCHPKHRFDASRPLLCITESIGLYDRKHRYRGIKPMLLSAQKNGNDLPERSGNEQLSEHQSFTKTSPFLPFFRPCGREKQSSGFPERVFCQEKRMLKKIIGCVPVEIKKGGRPQAGGRGMMLWPAGGRRRWSWWESNPRPNKETIRFLHAYSRLHFHVTARPGPPTGTLSSKTSPGRRGPCRAISDLPAPPVPQIRNNILGATSRSLTW